MTNNSLSCYKKEYEVTLIDSKATEDDLVEPCDLQVWHSSRQQRSHISMLEEKLGLFINGTHPIGIHYNLSNIYTD
jgi:hypothetical protein